MSKTLNMTQGNPMKLLLFFALPLMLGNVFQQLYTVVDIAIVGRGVGMDALAALGTVDWLNWMMLGLAQGFTQGFSVRISQKFGEGDHEGLRRTIGQSALLAIGISIICTVFIQLTLPLFLTFLRVPAELWPMSELYSRVLMAGLPAVVFYNFCSAVLRAVGDSKTPLMAMVAAAITNIVLDCVAVFVLNWGIGGAAAATVLAQCLSGLLCCGKIRKAEKLRFGKEEMKPDRQLCGDLLHIGTPVAVKNVTISLGGMTIQTIVNGFGMSFIAGFTASNKLYGLLEIAAISYGYAVTTYVGQNFGAHQYPRIKQGMKSATVLSLATSVVIAAVMILFGRPITMLFISSDVPEMVIAAGNTAYLYLFCMSVSLPVLYLLYVYQAAMQGMGNTMVPMASGLIELVLRVGIALVVGWSGFANGIFGAEVIAWYGAAIFVIINYYRNLKQLHLE